MTAGVTPDGITVLRTEADAESKAEDPRRLLDTALARQVRLRTHDAADPLDLAYLAATEEGEAVLLDRLLTDADVVVPIGCYQPAKTPGYFGIHSSIFPTFSDEPTQARFRRDELSGKGQARHALKHEVDQVAWLLGISFTIQIIPAARDSILHVVAGQCDVVRRRCRELYQAAWNSPVAGRTSLVVAAMEGGPAEQTWENLGYALAQAGRLVEDGGAIAVCCDLAAEPVPAVRRMAAARSRTAILNHIRQHHPIDAIPAMQLAHALDRGRVYLLSRLDPGLVEQLEMVPVDGPEELGRLVRRNPSCTVLSNVPRVIAAVEDE
jgi:nickel-dependent lactate racemase